MSLKGESDSPLVMDQGVSAESGVEVDLMPLVSEALSRSGFTRASIDVSYEGTPGSLIGSLTSQDRSSGLISVVPIRDLGRINTSTGSYPVRMDGDYQSLIAITSTAIKRSYFVATLDWEGGGTYLFGKNSLEAGETRLFDIRRIRDEAIKDARGSTLPPDLETAKFHWSVIGDQDVRLNGRSEVMSILEGVRATYCGFLCCPDNYSGPIPDGDALTFVGSTFTIASTFENCDCHNNCWPPTPSTLDLTIANPSICSVSESQAGTTLGTGLAFGSTIGSYFQTYQNCTPAGIECSCGSGGVENQLPVTIPTVAMSMNKGIARDATGLVNVTVSYPSGYSGSALPITLQLDTLSGTGAAVFTNNNSATITTSQTGSFSISIKGTTTSSTADNIRVRAIFNGSTLSAKLFSVIWVTVSMRSCINCPVSADNNAYDAYDAATGQTHLGQFSAGVVGVELIGTVAPSNFADTSNAFVMRRRILSARGYKDTVNGSTQHMSIEVPQLDDLELNLQDQDPQSCRNQSCSQGKIYDLDVPGIVKINSEATGTITRFRVNFSQWAEYDGKTASDEFSWYSRSSLLKNGATSFTFENSISGDNQASTGTTPVTWNLQ